MEGDIPQNFDKNCLNNNSCVTSSLELPKISLSKILSTLSSNSVVIKDEILDAEYESKDTIYENVETEPLAEESNFTNESLQENIDFIDSISDTKLIIVKPLFVKKEKCNALNIDQVHHKPKQFACKYCCAAFVFESQLETHEECIHKIIKNFSCSLCNKKFSVKQHLDSHIKLHKGIEDFSCDICQKKCGTRNSLNIHLKLAHCNRHENLKKYTCNICDKYFYYQYLLESHIEIMHKEIEDVNCSICSKVFNSRYGLYVHTKNMHEKLNNIYCDVCGKIFTRLTDLNTHVMLMHKNGEGCKQKEKIAVLTGNNNSHKEKCTQKDKNTVFECPKQRISYLERQKLYGCIFCSQLFASKSWVKKHIDTVHMKISDSTCNICGKEFNNKLSCKEHIKSVHKEIKDSTCHICGKKFTSNSKCKEHIKCVHKGIKDFLCNICARAFGREGHLKRHIRTVHQKSLVAPALQDLKN